MNDLTEEQLQAILNIISAESQLNALKRKHKQLTAIKEQVCGQQRFAQQNAAIFGMYGDCGDSYESEREEMDAKMMLMESLTNDYFNSQEVVEQSRLVGFLKAQFQQNHPEHYETMRSMLQKTQKQREHLQQTQANAKKKAAKYCANLAFALHGLKKELHKEQMGDDEFDKMVHQHCYKHPDLADRKYNPMNTLHEVFRANPSKMEGVVQTAQIALGFSMSDERRELIHSLIQHIQEKKACF